MMKTAKVAVCLALMPADGSAASPPPQTEISNAQIRARIYLPDAQAGFYRGTRFDWSGVIGSLEFAGHNYYPQWFQRTDQAVHDFIYDGADIVAGPCTAVTGPTEEFARNLGYDEAAAGGTFIKIGVGVLRKPDAGAYDNYRLYPIVDGGKWTIRTAIDSVDFRQELADPSSGFGYDYRKKVAVAKDAPRLVLDHSIRNTGKRAIKASVYNHNFLYIDRQPPGPGVTLTLPFNIQAEPAPNKNLVEIRGNAIHFLKTLSGEESVYMGIHGFGAESKDYDLRIEHRRSGAALRITANRPLSRAALWAIRAPLSPEPFIDFAIEPGEEFTWQIVYDHYLVNAQAPQPARP
ncbi:MAG: hypothetical protein AB9869_25730 [Verrucomicrobiia bacterium]